MAALTLGFHMFPISKVFDLALRGPWGVSCELRVELKIFNTFVESEKAIDRIYYVLFQNW